MGLKRSKPERASIKNVFYKDVIAHQFTVCEETFAWMDGMYFKKNKILEEGGSFGADALLNNTVRNATIMTEDGAGHFATLSWDNFHRSIKKIERDKEDRFVKFIQSIPCF